MKITYTKKGDYLFPDLILKESKYQIGKYGMLRRTFLKEYRTGHYTSMLLSGKLDQHLAEIDRVANEGMELLTDQIAKQEGVNEELKVADIWNWIQRMNNIRNRAEEIVLAKIVYA